MPHTIFGVALDQFRDQLDKLDLNYAINIANYLEIEISEIIPNNKFILNLSKEKEEIKE